MKYFAKRIEKNVCSFLSFLLHLKCLLYRASSIFPVVKYKEGHTPSVQFVIVPYAI
jgi:hypothetical protein